MSKKKLSNLLKPENYYYPDNIEETRTKIYEKISGVNNRKSFLKRIYLTIAWVTGLFFVFLIWFFYIDMIEEDVVVEDISETAVEQDYETQDFYESEQLWEETEETDVDTRSFQEEETEEELEGEFEDETAENDEYVDSIEEEEVEDTYEQEPDEEDVEKDSDFWGAFYSESVEEDAEMDIDTRSVDEQATWIIEEKDNYTRHIVFVLLVLLNFVLFLFIFRYSKNEYLWYKFFLVAGFLVDIIIFYWIVYIFF